VGSTKTWIAVSLALVVAAAGATWLASRGGRTDDSSPAGSATSPIAASTTGSAPVRSTNPRREHVAVAPPDASPSSGEAPKTVLVRFLVRTAGDDPKPIAGARVEVKPDGAEPVVLVTGDDGAAVMPSPIAAQELGYSLTAKGFVPDDGVADVAASAEVDARMSPGMPLTGRVLDGPSGLALAGARVFACWQDGSFIAETTTDAAGTYRLDALPTEQEPEVSFRAAGHANECIRYDPRSGPLDVHLDPGGRIAGVVRTKDGTPVPGAHVELSPGAPHDGRGGRASKADDSGAYAFDGLGLGYAYDVGASDDKVQRAIARVVATRDAPNVAQDLILGGGASLTVVVRNADGLVEFGDAVRICRDADLVAEGFASPGEDGVLIAPVLPGRFSVHVWSDSFGEATTDIDVGEGEAKRVELTAPSRGPVTGVVVDETGAPVAGATLEVHESFGCGSEVKRGAAVTRDDGSFGNIPWFARTANVRVSADGHADTTCSVDPPDGPLRLVLPRAVKVRFSLRRPEACAASTDADVKAMDGEGVELASASYDLDSERLDAVFIAPLATRRISIDVRGYRPVGRGVCPDSSRETDLGEIVLDPGRVFRGRVATADGVAVARAIVMVDTTLAGDMFLPSAAASSRDDGSFEVSGLEVGPVDVRVEASGFLTLVRRVDADDVPRPFAATLERGVAVGVFVTDESGLTAEGASVDASPADRVHADVRFDETSRGSFAGRLTQGRWHFFASAGDRRVDKVVEVTGENGQSVTLRLAK
jgi:hypothetical protein